MFIRRESFKEFLRRFPFLSLIIAANVAAFLYMGLRVGVSDSYRIVDFGGILSNTTATGEYWRLFTYAFLHDGLTHLLMNMFFLIVIAPPLEVMLGRLRMALLFLFSVFTTAFFVLYIGSQNGVGASGFCYGVLGMYIFIVMYHKQFLDPDSRKIVLIFTAIGWVGTLIIPGISFYGHLGGFVGGIVFGYLVVRDRRRLQTWYPRS